MGTKRKVQQRTVESKKKLLDSAYTLFAEKGYYNTNTKELVHYAGISIGNFYNYYQDKGDIYCALLEEYCSNSRKAMSELTSQMTAFETPASCREFLLTYLKQLLERFNGTNKFFEDSAVIAKENERVRSILSETEECIISMMENFLKKRYPDRQEDFYIRARMLYMITDRVSRDILCVGTARQKKDYMELLADEILHYTFEL